MNESSTSYRYSSSQKNRTLIHPSVGSNSASQGEEETPSPHQQVLTESHSFVVCADSQIGITSINREWETELAYCRQAISAINDLQPRPLFCCCCGDLVDMTASIFAGTSYGVDKTWTEKECHDIQDEQNQAFADTWKALHDDIALVCLCGNHDVGNRPTKATIQRFTSVFGDDFLAFWANGTYNMVVNTSLFYDPTGAKDLYNEQLEWLEDRLQYARNRKARNIFVFGHHPWFLYNDKETGDDMKGYVPFPDEWRQWCDKPWSEGFSDGYFPIPLERRQPVLDLFERYQVTAAFSGHFHQNLLSKTSFGMPMIVTSSMSMVFESTGNKRKDNDEPNTRGIRIVNVRSDPDGGAGTFDHRFVSIP